MNEYETEWVKPGQIEQEVEDALSEYPPVVRQLLFNRDIRTKTAAEAFFSQEYSDLIDPFELHDTKAAAETIEKAISEKGKIVIHGDFDVDGMSASSILWSYLYRDRGADVLPYIPSRVDEGYGMSEKSLDAVIKMGADLVISVDCGIRDAELIATYRKKRNALNFVITDHHQLADDFPEEVPVVHPLHPEGEYPFPYISGATVAWKLVAAMEKRRKTKFSWKNVPGIDLVAFATVCDMMPLSGENRTLVALGVEEMNSHPRPGIKAVKKEAGIDSGIDAYHLGYVLGPRVNAAGRIGDPMDGVRLLSTGSEGDAHELALKLGKLNKERQDMTDSLINEVRIQIEERGTGKHLYFAYGNDWPEGIVGLVAGKIQEWYHRPVVVVSKGETSSRGSARSVSGFNIVDAIDTLKGLLETYGGHEQAAGFTIPTDNIEEFRNRLEDLAESSLSSEDLAKKMLVDAVVSIEELDWDLMRMIEKFKPFGYGNRKPLFWVTGAKVEEARGVGDDKHLKMTVKGKDAAVIDCIYFNAGKAVGNILPGMVIDILGYLDVNSWNGKESLQVNVKEIKVEV